MQRYSPGLIAALAMLTGYNPAVAEDIDLFVQPPGVANGIPNVLIILDNTANWKPPFDEQMAALADTFSGLGVDENGNAKFRVGLMLFTETGRFDKGADGGYVRAAIRDMDAANQVKYAALVNSFDPEADKGNAVKPSKTLADAYQYFSGLPPLTGKEKSKTDYTGNVFGAGPSGPASKAIYLIPEDARNQNALEDKNKPPYRSPIINGSCAGNYIIYISNGQSTENDADNTAATNWLATAAANAGVAGATTPLPIFSLLKKNMSDEWARFMKKSPRRITTYTIDVKPKVTGMTDDWTAVLQSMATTSGGKYFDGGSGATGEEIRKAMGVIFSEIQAVNSVFASVSLPVSVNAEGTYLNQVYIGMFRPDEKALPRWSGNLKQYKLGIVADALRTLDADDSLAINSSTGFITECARSFWTPTVADAYWAFRPQGGCTVAGTNYDNSNYPDGKIVEKGAQAYVLRSNTARTVRTCSSVFASCSAAGALLTFSTATALQAELGAADAGEHSLLVDWQKGIDKLNENNNDVAIVEMRSTAHGDVIHSRPIALNFGTDLLPKVVVFYGGNDGILRAVNGNRANAYDGVAAGKEIWSFIPPEFYGSIKRLRDNNVTISFKGTEIVDPAPLPKPYGMDGAITSYEKSSLFVGMRRGGRALYAFNISNIVGDPDAAPAVAPENPRLLWKVGCPSLTADDDCSAGFDDIGQTWSSARPFKSEGYVIPATVTKKPMLIMGGGYDNCEDADPVSDDCKTNGKGHRIYVLDAAEGTILREFTTDRGVVGDVFVINDTVSGLAKWAYAADLGGNIYRVSGETANEPIGDSDPADWTITKVAALGCATPSDCADNRKFLFMPDIVEKGGTYYLLVGSGDREKPLGPDKNGDPYWPSAYGTENFFFMVMDTPTDEDWLGSEDTNCGTEVICMASLLAIGAENPDPTLLAEKKGWYLELNEHEQAVTSAITIFGTTTFSTHTPFVPVAGQCTGTLGTARVYNIRFLNASARVGEDRSETISGGGLPPSPVAGLVTLDDGTTYPFIIGADGNSPLESRLPSSPSTGTQPKSLTYWYLEK